MPDRFKDNPIAAEEWNSVCQHLSDMQLLSKVDRAALEIYCTYYAKYRDAEEKVKKYGDVVLVGKNKDHPQVSPWYTAMNKYADEVRKWLLEYAMTPAARARCRVQADDKQENKWEGFRLTG